MYTSSKKSKETLLRSTNGYFMQKKKMDEILIQSLLKPTTSLKILLGRPNDDIFPFKAQNINQIFYHSKLQKSLLTHLFVSQMLKLSDNDIIIFQNSASMKIEKMQIFDPTQNRKENFENKRKIHVFRSKNIYEFLGNLRKAKHLTKINQRVGYVVIDDVEFFNLRFSKFTGQKKKIFGGEFGADFDRRKYEKMAFIEIMKLTSENFFVGKNPMMNKIKVLMFRRSRMSPFGFCFKRIRMFDDQNYGENDVLVNQGSLSKEDLLIFLKEAEIRSSKVRIKIFYIFDFYEKIWIQAFKDDIEKIKSIHQMMVEDNDVCVCLCNLEEEDKDNFFVKVLKIKMDGFEVIESRIWDFTH